MRIRFLLPALLLSACAAPQPVPSLQPESSLQAAPELVSLAPAAPLAPVAATEVRVYEPGEQTPSSYVAVAKGAVVLRKDGCDYFLVETTMGFALLEWYGGNDPELGDVLVGDFESYGTKDIYNLTADAETRVWVEEYWLGEDRAIEELYEKC